METESDLRQRRGGAGDNPAADNKEDFDDEDNLVTEDNLDELMKDLPQSSDNTIEAVDSALSGLSAKSKNWLIRFFFTCLMIGGFVWLIYMGPISLMATVLVIQIKCFQEIINIGHAVYRVHDLPWFRTLSWYLLLCSNYYFFGEAQIDNWGTLLKRDEFLYFLVHHHRLISFGLYCMGFVWFVTSLKKGYYMRQFSLFAWTHVTLLLIVTQSYMIIQNIFQGLIWFLVPVSMIICNDIMAYMFGFFFGRTPLIKLSPKKTWEGFIGGAFSTIIFGIVLSYILVHFPFFICPLESQSLVNGSISCSIPPSFRIREFALLRPFPLLFKLLGWPPVIKIYPMLFHSFVMGLFASLLGPFGGFFASGFKRAFKIKDFGAVIPGHGGLMDRFDCQLLIGTFVSIYIQTFIRTPNPGRLVQQIMFLRPDQQMMVYRLLQEKLSEAGLFNATSPM